MLSRDEQIKNLLTRNVEEVIDREHLEAALRAGKKLRVKLGIDPTGDKIHIGYATTLWKLRGFQDLGCQAVLIIGDFTAQIGDASDKTSKRPMLTKQEVKKNMKNYLPQIGRVIDLKKAEVRYNSEWLAKLDLREVSELAEIFTFRQILERRNFWERWEKHEEISYREGLYPLMQGYDSVAVKADVELGGSDQLFNLIAGRKIQEHYGQKPQDILTTKLLLGLDGRKMSKSWGNTINIDDSPDEQFGKAMSLKDEYMKDYFIAVTEIPDKEIKKIEDDLARGANPKSAKERLAFEVVKRYSGEFKAKSASEWWETTFSKKEIPADVPSLKVASGTTPVLLIVRSGVVKSKSEARRLVEQGALEVGGKVKKDPNETLDLRGGEIVKIGKRHFFRIKI